jgi:hypothetical protein
VPTHAVVPIATAGLEELALAICGVPTIAKDCLQVLAGSLVGRDYSDFSGTFSRCHFFDQRINRLIS